MRYCKILLIILLTLFVNRIAYSQCKEDFPSKAFPSEIGASTGRIEIALVETSLGSYVLSLYKVSGEIKLIQKKNIEAPNTAIFSNLEVADYYVMIEWGSSCKKTIGGIEGIQIFEKAKDK